MSKNVFDQYVEQMPGAAVGGANAPMSTESTGIANTKNYVGTRKRRGKSRRKKDWPVVQMRPTPGYNEQYITSAPLQNELFELLYLIDNAVDEHDLKYIKDSANMVKELLKFKAGAA